MSKKSKKKSKKPSAAQRAARAAFAAKYGGKKSKKRAKKSVTTKRSAGTGGGQKQSSGGASNMAKSSKKKKKSKKSGGGVVARTSKRNTSVRSGRSIGRAKDAVANYKSVLGLKGVPGVLLDVTTGAGLGAAYSNIVAPRLEAKIMPNNTSPALSAAFRVGTAAAGAAAVGIPFRAVRLQAVSFLAGTIIDTGLGALRLWLTNRAASQGSAPAQQPQLTGQANGGRVNGLFGSNGHSNGLFGTHQTTFARN